MRIEKVVAYPLASYFKDIYGNEKDIPQNVLALTAANLTYPRHAQFATLVEVTTSNGMVGYGEAYGIPNSRFAADIVNKLMSNILIGKNPLDSRVIYNSLMSLPLLGGYSRGFIMAAISGIDQALWDIKGKYFNVPVYMLLGGMQSSFIDCYASPVLYHEKTEDTAQQAKEYVKAGFMSMKLKIGRGIDADVEQIAVTRKSIGNDIKLLLDANGAYDPMTAILLAKEVEQYDIYWFEEPIPSENIGGYKYIRNRINMYVAAGENESTLNSFRDLITNEAVDFIMPSLARAGGITGVMDIATFAQAFSTRVSPHGVGSGVVLLATIQLLASINNAGIFEYNQLLNPLRVDFGRNIEFNNGKLSVPESPGLGIDIDFETIKKYLMKEYS